MFKRCVLTIILGHSLLGAAYATVGSKARLSELSLTYEEVGFLDLGCQTLRFFLVTLPMIAQSLVLGIYCWCSPFHLMMW